MGIQQQNLVIAEYRQGDRYTVNGITSVISDHSSHVEMLEKIEKLIDQMLCPVTYYFYWLDGRKTSTNKTDDIGDILISEGFPNWKKELFCYSIGEQDRDLQWDSVNKVWKF